MQQPLFGRQALLETLDRLVEHSSIVHVFGLPGIGKTRVLQAWARRRLDRALYVNAHGVTHARGCFEAAARLFELEASVLESEDALREGVAGELGSWVDGVLLCDGCASDVLASSWWTTLRAHVPSLRIVFATRTRATTSPGVALQVPPLPDEDARAMYHHGLSLRQGSSEPVQGALLELLSGWPALIEHVAARSIAWETGRLIEELGRGVSLWPLELQEALASAWETLDAPLPTWLRGLCDLPGTFALEQVERYIDAAMAWTHLESLHQAGWLARAEKGRYHLPEALRVFLRARGEGPRRELRACVAQHAQRIYRGFLSLDSGVARAHLVEDAPVFRAFLEGSAATPASGWAALALSLEVSVNPRREGLRDVRRHLAHALHQASAQQTPELYGHLMLQSLLSHAFGELAEPLAFDVDDVLEHANKHQLRGLCALALDMRAGGHAANHRDDQARQDHLASIALARQEGDAYVLARALRRAGWFFSVVNEQTRGREMLRESLSLHRRDRDSERADIVQLLLAKNLGSQGFYHEALEHAHEVSARASGERVRLQVLLIHTELLLHMEAYSEALEQMKALLALLEQTTRWFDVAGWWEIRASVYARLLEWPQAQESLLKALLVFEKQDDAFAQRRVLTNLAATYVVQDQAGVARQYLRRSLDLDDDELSPMLGLLHRLLGALLGDGSWDAVLAASKEYAPMLRLFQAEDASEFEACWSVAAAWARQRTLHSSVRWMAGLAQWSLSRRAPGHTRPHASYEDGVVSWHPSGERLDLTTRGAMRRILEALVALHAREPDAQLSVWDAFEAGWPGEEIQAEHMSHRVRVAVNRLRGLGLRQHIVTGELGYRWDPGERPG